MKKKKSIADAMVDGLRQHALDKLEEKQKETETKTDKPKEIVLRYPMFEQPEQDYEFREIPPMIITEGKISKLYR